MSEKIEKLKEQWYKYDKSWNAEEEYRDFIERYPKENLGYLSLEDYTNIKTNGDIEYFTHWIERKTENCGKFRTASSYAYGIYKVNPNNIQDENEKKNAENKYKAFDESNKKSKDYLTKSDAENYFETIIRPIIEKLANFKNMQSTKPLDINYARKIAYMYNIDKMIPIYKKEVLETIADFLGIKKEIDFSSYKATMPILINIKKIFNINNEIDIKLSQKIASFLWEKFGNLEDKEIKNQLLNKKEEYMPNNTKQPLNQILYGSPGTGKTYNTINKALEIILEKENNDEIKEILEKDNPSKIERTKLKEKFEEYKNIGQIEFVTFHQSYGYEEFIEGIKANTNNNQISYGIENGILKKLCEKAEGKEYLIDDILVNDDSYIWKISLGSTYENEIKNKCFKDNEIRIGWNDVKEIDDENFNKLGTNNKSTIINFIEDMKIGDLVISIYNQKKIDGIGIIESDFYIDEQEGYNKFRKVKWLSKEILDLTKLNGNKVFVQKTVYKINRFKPKDLLALIKKESKKIQVETDNSNKNYILIIDEINRGNISKIFGELITLIELSKRIGKDEQIKVKLPYSGDDFGVPQNLYIIGTMNTADRSIAPIDTALRRRFVFEEMAPNSSLLSKEKTPNIYDEVNLQSLLEAINTRIEYLYDRDHTIGHAYLIDVKDLDDLKFAFKNKIIPLLAEYFYEDWENIDLVLNSNGFIESKKDDDKYLSKKIQDRIRNKITYKVSDNSTWTKEHFISIYKKTENEE